MNIDNINIIIDALRLPDGAEIAGMPFGFYMGSWHRSAWAEEPHYAAKYNIPIPPESRGDTHCGTVGCIGGLINIIREGRHDVQNDSEGSAAAWLGITGIQSNELFYPTTEMGHIWHASREQAIQVLEHLRDTGEVNWEILDGQEEGQPGQSLVTEDEAPAV